MDPFVEIVWTSGSLDEARKISRHLVQERLVFTSQIIPWIESITLLDGMVETAQESRIVMKARRSSFEKIATLIANQSTYDIPEISMRTLDLVGKEFEAWVAKAQKH